jgi:hypothetical protein
MLVKRGTLTSKLRTDCRSLLSAVYSALLVQDGQRYIK